MNTSSHCIEVSGLQVQIVRKDIKNLHLGVYPPDGRVRVAVPRHVSDENVRLAVVSKLGWIKRQQAGFTKQPRQTPREYVSGESHYFFGKRYLLEVIEQRGAHRVVKRHRKLQLFVNPGTSTAHREQAMNRWYRQELKQRVSALVEKWEPVIGKQVREWGIKRMKTKWGSCNINAARIWINLELAKKAPECLEYILVHEMVHLLERHHNDNFKVYMDRFLPQWRLFRETLKRAPLGHHDWSY